METVVESEPHCPVPETVPERQSIKGDRIVISCIYELAQKLPLIITDSYSSIQFRYIGALVNMDTWDKAFDVIEGEKLYKRNLSTGSGFGDSVEE